MRPLYESYCFPNLPGTIEHLLTGQTRLNRLPEDVLGELNGRHKRVVVLFVDGFGWRFVMRYFDELTLLRRAMKEGVVSIMTSQFPSTTAAHVTTMHTGLPVGASGVFEWFYYEPEIDRVIAPLLFVYAEEHNKRETLTGNLRAIPGKLFPSARTAGYPLFYQRLNLADVPCHVHQFADYADSTFTRAVCTGATLHPYRNLGQACQSIVAELKTGSPGYHMFYVDLIDSALHKNGPISPVVDSLVHDVFAVLEEQLLAQISGRAGETLILLIADHGQVEVDPERTYYLNWRLPGLENRLRTNDEGKVLRFGGSARDLFLYVRPEELNALQGELRERLIGRAEVWRVDDLIAQGIFGEVPADSPLRRRIGELAVLPYRDHSVYWREGKFDMHFKGHHGGLTREEMEIPLIAMIV